MEFSLSFFSMRYIVMNLEWWQQLKAAVISSRLLDDLYLSWSCKIFAFICKIFNSFGDCKLYVLNDNFDCGVNVDSLENWSDTNFKLDTNLFSGNWENLMNERALLSKSWTIEIFCKWCVHLVAQLQWKNMFAFPWWV